MAKKKKKKKAVSKKAKTRKKPARRRTGKTKGSRRKPAAKRRTRKPARRAAPRKKARRKRSRAGNPPPLHVWPYSATPPSCDIRPHGGVHAPPKRQNGSVNFFAHGTCTILFDNPDVFGTDHMDLSPGDNPIDVEANPDPGQEVKTNVSIDGCPGMVREAMLTSTSMSTSQGRVFNGPTDIIVP